MRSLLFLCSILYAVSSYKYLIYSPLFGHSHSTFLENIADVLVEAGHEVTMLIPVLDNSLLNMSATTRRINTIYVEQDPRVARLLAAGRKGMFRRLWTMNPDPRALLAMARNMSLMFSYACDKTTENRSLLAHLRSENFDVGIAEPFFICGLALFEQLGIRATIGASSNVHSDIVSWYIGEPIVPSYVPSMTSSAGDRLSLMGRMANIVGTLVGMHFFENTFNEEGKVLTRRFGANYSGHAELLAGMSFLFTNAQPFLNYPRPVIHKTVEIGGITVNEVQKLDKKWDRILNLRPQTVLVSFGSVAKSKDMPFLWKHCLLDVFASMPNVTFIWKYEEKSDMAKYLPNVRLVPWVPQTALLADSRLSLFVTHGGLGSTTEVAHLGKPAIVIPLFAEQPRNAEMLARHGGARVLQKADLAKKEVLGRAIEEVLEDESFAVASRRLSSILHQRPVSAKQLVVSHAEFVAKFGPVPHLDPAGRHLSLIEYFLVDVFLLLLFSLIGLITCVFYSFRLLFRFSRQKLKLQ